MLNRWHSPQILWKHFLVGSLLILINSPHCLQSFHCKYPRKMAFSRMDPSCTIGFYAKGQKDFECLCAVVFEVCDRSPFVEHLTCSFWKACRKVVWNWCEISSFGSASFSHRLSPHLQRRTPCSYLQKEKVRRRRRRREAMRPQTISPTSRGATNGGASTQTAAWTSLFCYEQKITICPRGPTVINDHINMILWQLLRTDHVFRAITSRDFTFF